MNLIFIKKFLILLLFIFFIYIGISILVTNIAFNVSKISPIKNPQDYSLQYETVNFKSAGNEKINIEGWWIPSTENNKVIIWSHGLRSEKSGGDKLELIKNINKLGYSVLTIDLRSHGDSTDGKFGFGIIEKNDIKGAINFLFKEKGITEVGLSGVSYGAVTSIAASIDSKDSNIVGIFADTPYYNPLELLTKEVTRKTPIPKSISSTLKFGIINSGKLFFDLDMNKIPKLIARLEMVKFPIIIIGCKRDQTVPISHQERVFKYSPAGSKLYKFKNCHKHGEIYESNSEYYIKIFDEYFTLMLSKDF